MHRKKLDGARNGYRLSSASYQQEPDTLTCNPFLVQRVLTYTHAHHYRYTREATSVMDANNDDGLAGLAADVDRFYERLVSLYWHELRAFVIGRTGNIQDAEDIVQDAFLRAYRALRRYSTERRAELKARSWLYKITWNLYFTRLSTTKASKAAVVPLDLSEGSSLLDVSDEQEEQPELTYERGERRQELEELLSTLPEHYRAVVSLYYFDEMSHQEIANTLHQPLGTVKVYVQRGLRLLRKAMTLQSSVVDWNKQASEVG